MLEVIIFLIVVILLLVALILMNRRPKQKGGYVLPYSFLKPSQELAISMYKNSHNNQMDYYCKSIALYFFGDIGFEPSKIRYINGGDIAKHIREVNKVIVEHGIHGKNLNEDAAFQPDFILADDYRILIIEFDEGNDYHQCKRSEYVAKNFIYDQLLCDSAYNETRNLCILRITYNDRGIDTIINEYKQEGVRYIASIILYTWKHMLGINCFMSQYVLAKINLTSNNTLILKELISLRVRNLSIIETFSPSNVFYSGTNLNEASKDGKLDRDIFNIEDVIPMFKKELFDEYDGSDYERYFLSKKRFDIPDNPFNDIIDSFSDIELGLSIVK